MPLPYTSGPLRMALRQTAPPRRLASPLRTARPLSCTTSRRAEINKNPQRDAQKDREKINTDANEYAKSGTDDTAAGNEEAAFNPNITDPQEAKKKAGEGNDVNPLDASPANPELGKPTREVSGERKEGET